VKPLFKISGLVCFAAVLCFLPCAFGQSTAAPRLTGSGHAVLNVEPSSFLAFALTTGDEFFNNDKNGKNKNGCDNRTGHCDAVARPMPEGGASLMYLLLAGLACLGGMVFRSRRQVSMRQN
jgi:hypothetical protein